jgi:hypothetical protein
LYHPDVLAAVLGELRGRFHAAFDAEGALRAASESTGEIVPMAE